MKTTLILASLLAVSSVCIGQTYDINASTAGGCNSPASSCVVYTSSSPAVGEMVLIIASWLGQSLTATVSDAVNAYNPIVGPTNAAAGIVRAESWYAINVGSTSSFTVTLSGPSGAGFTGILIYVISITGFNKTIPIDSSFTSSATGNSTSLSIGPVVPTYNKEMVWGMFLIEMSSTPYSAGSGWTNYSGQEAVSLLEFKNLTSGGVQTATATQNNRNNWIGFTVGIVGSTRCGKSGTC